MLSLIIVLVVLQMREAEENFLEAYRAYDERKFSHCDKADAALMKQ
jgi:hypothetical protein